ncbi:MAG: hypothetical protein MSJ26_08625 [Oscillospiraceae bacterium]|nr:hypothetical protein [Oscillospiraceae bacterium]
MPKKILVHLGAFAASIAVLWGALMLTLLIPKEKIYDNMLKSAEGYGSLAAYSFESGNRLNGIADNYADAILLNIILCMDGGDPLRGSLDTRYYSGGEMGVNWGLYAAVNGELPDTDYSRYWHGSAIFIRPLLLFTDVNGIKAVGFGAVSVLTAAVCFLLIRRKQYFGAAALIFSLLSVQFYNVRLSMEYIPMFILSLAMCICFICFEKKGDMALSILSVICGTAAAFFDFLTAETLSILLPLILVMIIRKQENRLGSLRENIILSAKCGGGWGAAYGGTFIMKWALASAVTGENKFISALSSAEVRLSGEAEELPFFKQLFLSPLANLSTMFGGESRVDGGRVAVCLLLTVLVFGGVYLIFRKKTHDRDFAVIMLILGAVPYLRYLVLSNHSYLHEFFTYRAQAAAVLALCAAVWFGTELSDSKKPRKLSRKKAARRI